MDLSRPLSDFLPRARSATGGVLRSLLLLGLALALALAVGVLGVLGLRLVAPTAPAWIGLPLGLAALVATLRWLARRFAWLMPWYYLLPAILFLLTFTLFPLVLTVGLAFTDYAGSRNGQLSVRTETAVVASEGRRVEIADPRVLACADLRRGCAGVRARLYASGQADAVGVALEGSVLTLAAPPPEGRTVDSVGLFLPAVGSAFQFAVERQDGPRLHLVRAPAAAAVELDEVELFLDRVPIERRIVDEDGAVLTLDRDLPDGVRVEALARYNDFGFVGLRNFAVILGSATRALGPVFLWNVLFAFATVVLNTAAGLLLAVLLNNPALRLRGLYRTLLILPWALPNIITIQVWKGFLNQNFGAINRLLMLLDVTPEPVNWLLGGMWPARAAVLLVNLWLGYPFMMVAILGALSAIPSELYEAARIDGASPWQSFRGVTAPLLRSALIPITLTAFAFNFNNFNIIFLLTDGGPAVDWGTSTARGTDILISWAYNTAFRNQGGYAYGLGSAISLLIFAITLAVSLVNFRVTGALREEGAR